MSGQRRLINELRRRNVPRAVIAYWVVAWTSIEVGSLIEQALFLPEWVDLAIIILSIAGLPVVIVVSWIFEWGPRGLAIDCRDPGATQIPQNHRELASQIAREVYEHLLNDLKHSRRHI